MYRYTKNMSNILLQYYKRMSVLWLNSTVGVCLMCQNKMTVIKFLINKKLPAFMNKSSKNGQ